MPFHDQHLHSRHSFDSETEPAANVEAAIARGLTGLTFTEHFDTHPEDWERCVYDDGAYSETIARLRETYGDRIFIGKGIEVCYQPEQMDFILDFLDRHTFDMVMMSVHYFGERSIHTRHNWEGIEVEEGTRLYFEKVLEGVRHAGRLREERGRVFDVLGHLDMAKRYTVRFFDRSAVATCAEQIDEILRECLAAELVPEINTSTLRQNHAEPMPGPSTIRRYAELGGTCMSLGSDAHRAEHVGEGFDHAAGLLREVGIRHTAQFRERHLRQVPL